MITVDVALPTGTVAIPLEWEPPASTPRAVIALGHGAGSGREHPFLVGFAAALRDAGYATARFDFPYRVAGRRMPGPAAHAVAAWTAVMADLAARMPGLPIVAAGKSYGGRMASMAAAEATIDPAALVYLGYPFHAPGKPEAPRGAHLPAIAAPQLFVEGTVDPFIQPIVQFTDAVATCQDAEIVWISGGGHSFEVKGHKAATDEIGARTAASVLPFLRSRVV